MVITTDEKNKISIILALSFAVACLETIGVVSVGPLIYVIINEVDEYTGMIGKIYSLINMFMVVDSRKQFIVILGLFSIVILLISASFRIASSWYTNKFIELSGASLSYRLFKSFINRDYVELVSERGSDAMKNIISDADKYVTSLVRPIIQMITSILLAIL